MQPVSQLTNQAPSFKYTKMKLTSLLPLASAVMALPAASSEGATIEARQTLAIKSAKTDQYLYSITLPKFTSYRNAKNPSYLVWTSDGCSYSPDNPFNFPFKPACDRHDFGYRNYKAQSGRFTKAARKRIDDKFRVEYVFDLFFFTLSAA